ncbi:hypothetical protein AWB80_07551 [Caballeronia pedi]|uniref:Uncharacterized protein n=1 Tax=Caballeronia pedi TaxID=1777141 RepID=A0A158DV81_9BURK|nr:hypothetical protein [Caballeronia pedi]SAK98559.1 hypothetical protein AWB80_07551 [Caballeronia pedi]
MFDSIKKLVHDCLTENNGTSYCPFRVGGCALTLGGIPTFLGCAIYTTVVNGHFQFTEFGVGFGAMMTGMGVLAGGVALKARTDT